MYVLHGGWIPSATTAFVQEGQFYLWVESSNWRSHRNSTQKNQPRKHPRHLAKKALTEFLRSTLKLKFDLGSTDSYPIETAYFWLPANGKGPLPSPELSRYLDEPVLEPFTLSLWQVTCCQITVLTGTGFLTPVVAFLRQLYQTVTAGNLDCQLGADLLFWYRYAQTLPDLIEGDHYIPALKCEQQGPQYNIYTGWTPLGARYEQVLETYAPAMPLACRLGQLAPTEQPTPYAPAALLRHFSACWLTDIVTQTPFPRAFLSQIEGTVVGDCATATFAAKNTTPERLKTYQQWQAWRDLISRSQTDSPFYLTFRLDAPRQPNDP
ncbi:MAG: ATP-dependent helicase, partial [Cyanobacteria bacterium J06632_22]